MKKRWMNKPTLFFLFFIEFLVGSLVVSCQVWLLQSGFLEQFGISSWWIAICSIMLAMILFFIGIKFYSLMALRNVIYDKRLAWLPLPVFWLSLIILCLPVVQLFIYLFSIEKVSYILIPIDSHFPIVDVFERQFSHFLAAGMFFLVATLLAFYILLEYFLLKYSNNLHAIRIILYHRFVLVGNAISWFEGGWQCLVVKFLDVLFATWIVQSISRILWRYTEPNGISSIEYSEKLISPADPTNGTIFNSLSSAYQNISISVDYSGYHFGPAILSSIFSLLWNHWIELLALWFILEILGYVWASSAKLVIVNVSRGNEEEEKAKKGEKDGSKKAQQEGLNLSELLAIKLDRIKEIYRAVDEKRPIQSACGAGEPIDANIKVDRLEDISLSSTSEIKLGPFGIPASSVSALISHILMGPKITIGLYDREQDENKAETDDGKGNETGKRKTKQVLIASLSGKMGSQRWIVECAEPLEEDQRSKERSIEDMMTEMAHRIHATYSSMQSEKPGDIVSWRAMWNFNEGLRAYRDSLKTKKLQKYYLYRAEKKFIDALKEDSSFSQAHYNLGVVYAELNQPESAQDCFSKAIDVDPDCWEAYYALGISVFRKTKDVQQSYKILRVDMEKEKKEGIADDYRIVINLCERVLEIKSWEERFFEKDFTIKAKAYDLMGNAWARMACLQNENEEKACRQSNNHDDKEAYNLNKMEKAKRCLEKSVNYAWMALIKESVVHETVEDEAKIVTECTLDLAHVYLKLSEGSRDELRPMSVALIQAIYINPLDANLYYLLARFGEDEECLNFMKRVYGQIHLINPDSVRVKAYLNLIEYWRDNGYNWKSEPASWFKECEDCCDEVAYDRVFRFLASVVEDKDIEDACIRFRSEKLNADLIRLEGVGKKALPSIREKEKNCSHQDHLRVCLALCRLARYLNIYSDGKGSLDEPFSRLSEIVKDQEICSLLRGNEAIKNEHKISEFNLNCIENPFNFGSIFLELARLYAEEYVNSGEEEIKRDIDQNILNTCSKFVFKWKNSGDTGLDPSLKDYLEVFLKCSQICMICINKILSKRNILINKNEITNKKLINFYKKEICYYLVEAGRVLLELGNIRRSLEIDDLDTFRWDKVTGDDKKKFKDFLCGNFGIVDIQEVSIKDNSVTIKTSENEPIILNLNQEKDAVILKIDDIDVYALTAKKKNNELIVYEDNFDLNAKLFFKKALFILENVDAKEDEIKHNKIRMHMARSYLACGDLPNALKEAQMARYLNPLDYDERKVLGEIFYKLKEFKYGLSELNTALSYMPNDSEILLCIGRAYLSAGKDCKRKGDERNRLLRNARERLEEALNIADRSDVRHRGLIRYWIGRTLLEMGSYEEAVPHLRILADKDKRDLLPALYLGYAYLKCNSHEECESCLFGLIRSVKSKPLACEGQNRFITDKFYGRQYGDKRHINEILSRAYIYLAYSFAERDANLCDSWKLASTSQRYVDNLRETQRLEEKRARDGVIPDTAGILQLNVDRALLTVPAPNGANLMDLMDLSCIDIRSDSRLWEGYSIYGMNDYRIKIIPDPKDGLRKRKSKAHLAECAGTICYKIGDLIAAVDYLKASIALYPDAGAYLNLAKAYERMILYGKVAESRKPLIERKIRDLCQHVEAQDIRDEHKKDLDYFRRRWPDKEDKAKGDPGDSPGSGQNGGSSKPKAE